MSKNTNKPKILLAEDDVINQKVATMIFNKMKLKIDLVDNGIEAYELHKKKSYDIIFMDLHMPKLSGIEATKLIRAFEKKNSLNKTVAIIAITANLMEDNEDECLEAGMNGFISKPFSISDIR